MGKSANKSAGKTDSKKESKRKKYKKRKQSSSDGSFRDKYHRIVLPKLKLIYGWKRRGLSDEDIAVNLGIAYSTFKVYKGKYEELSAALSAGAHEAVLIVENALFEKSTGIKETVKKPMKVRKIHYDGTGRKVSEEECIEYGEEEVYIPPETAAAKFYLVNRAPEYWQDRGVAPLPEGHSGGIVMIPKRDDEE